MGRHGTRGAPSLRLGTPSRADRTPARPRRVTSGHVLVAAVAAGAALPAIQTLDAHTADATSTTELNRADLALASTQHAAGGAAHGVSPVAMATSSSSSGRSARLGSSGGSAGDATDVAALTKSMSVAREDGPPDFGHPYSAGDDDSLSGEISEALGLLGLPQKLAPGVKKIIMHESTGNPDAVNRTDSNAAAGTPSKGLMQLIDTTFQNAVLPSLAHKGIFDPVANITAGIRTMIANHGMDAVMDGGLRDSAGNYIGYGGAKLPDDGLGLASRS